MITVFISEQCVFHHAIADKRERVCHYVLARRSVKPVIWPFGPLVRHAKHSRNISPKWTSSDGYYIIWCRSPAPTKRRIIVPTEKEDNTTLACAGPKSSHHLWQRWWGRDCRSPEFVCWTWSPARTTEMTSQRMPQWKRSLIKFCFVFLYPLLHNLYSCDVLFLSKHSSVHWGGVKKGKDWNGHNISVNLSSRDRFHLMGSPINEVSTLHMCINSALTVNKSDTERVRWWVFSSFFCLDFH